MYLNVETKQQTTYQNKDDPIRSYDSNIQSHIFSWFLYLIQKNNKREPKKNKQK